MLWSMMRCRSFATAYYHACVKRADAAVTLPIRSLLPNRAVHSVSGNRIGKAGFLLTVLSPFPVRDRIRSAVCRIRVSPFSDAGSSDRGTDIRLLSRLNRFYCGRTGFTLPDGRLFRALPVTGTTSDAQTAQCPETVRSRNSDTVSKHSSFCCETKWRGRMD